MKEIPVLYEKKELQAEDIKAILFSLQAIFSEIKKYLLVNIL